MEIAAADLQKIAMFTELNVKQIHSISKHFTVKHFVRGASLVDQGRESNELLIILDGRAHVVFTNKDGNQVQFARLHAGECIGEMGIIDGSPHSASVYAEGHLRALSLGRQDFLRCVGKNPGLSAPIMRSLVRRLRRANGNAASLATLDAAGRLAHVLWELSEMDGADRIVRGQVRQKDLAKMTGLSLVAVNYGMKRLREQGAMIERGGQIHVFENKILMEAGLVP